MPRYQEWRRRHGASLRPESVVALAQTARGGSARGVASSVSAKRAPRLEAPPHAKGE